MRTLHILVVAVLVAGQGCAGFRSRKTAPEPVSAAPAPEAPPPATADSKPTPEAVATARARAKQGMIRYNANSFQEALGEYEAAHRAVPDPVFLFNMAQCHRKLNHRKEALDLYRSYLRNSPNAANRAEVEKQIAALQAAGA